MGVDEEMAERVLRAVELIPAGRVVSYGDLAELVGCGPRQVGAVLSRRGSEVPWWRVTNAAGQLPQHLREEVLVRWAREGITWKADASACHLRQHRADLPALANAYDADPAEIASKPR